MPKTPITHGGSRPVIRKDDGRLAKQPGYEKHTKVRFLSKDEETELKAANLTPRQRVEILLAWVRNQD